MYLIVIAWTYVTLMMAVAEATSPQGTLLGAFITFALYGLLPMGILVYILGTPSRKRAIKAREAAEQAAYDAEKAAQAAQVAQVAQAPSTPENAPSALERAAKAAAAPEATSSEPDAGSHATATAQHNAVAPVRKEP